MSESPRCIWNASRKALDIVAPILKGKSDIRNCRYYGDVRPLDHGMNVEERVLDKRNHRIVGVDEMQYGFMPERGTIAAVFILRSQQEEYHAKGKMLYLCLVDPEKAFDRALWNVLQWAMTKKGIP